MSKSFNAKVRMYRQGIGDCFLVTLPRKKSDTPFRMLIDCGVVLGTSDATNTMIKIVDSIQNATGGDTVKGKKGVIDLLVITHEHWDHVSGFNQVKDWADRFDVKATWAGWTEDPDNEQAQSLDKTKKRALTALTSAAAQLGVSGDQGAETISDLLGFYGLGGDATPAMMGLGMGVEMGARATTRSGRDNALSLSKNLTYLTPGGEPRKLDGVEDARVFILGPPTDERLLKKANPSKKNPETYGIDTYGLGVDGSGTKALDRLNAAMSDDGSPFSSKYEIPISIAQTMPFFSDHYFNSTNEPPADPKEVAEKPDKEEPQFPTELLPDNSWRVLENEWSSVAVDLAMKLDSATNNTSLAFAIELEPGGDVLLFPADAQVGNWLSWYDVKWDGCGVDQTVQDLLKRTRIYKTGHHASHNATLRELGLEVMEHPGLIAFVPVNEKLAHKKKWLEMPLHELMDRLKEKAKGRVLRADEDMPIRPKGIRKSLWNNFTDSLYTGETGSPDKGLFFEVTI